MAVDVKTENADKAKCIVQRVFYGCDLSQFAGLEFDPLCNSNLGVRLHERPNRVLQTMSDRWFAVTYPPCSLLNKQS
jgi:hypothetical protein